MLINRRSNAPFSGVDWIVVVIYLLLMLMGWMNIYSVTNSEETAGILDMSQRYGNQLVWIGISLFVAVFILLTDDNYFHYSAYLLYGIMILVLLAVLLFGREVNGSKSWFEFGSVRIQPAEFAKFTTSLALAKYMSSFSFNIRKLPSLVGVLFIIFLPASMILMQNDTGSALVYSCFFVMLYREGFTKWFYIVMFTLILLFVLSFVLEPYVLLFLIFMSVVVIETIVNGNVLLKISYVSFVLLLTLLFSVLFYAVGVNIDLYYVILISILLSIPLVVLYSYRLQLKSMIFFVAFFAVTTIISLSIDYIFDNVLKLHHQKRILDILGLESDVKNWGYNVNQSKIAIGSGGFSGKGYLHGTQTKFDFVPEQSTDFIFCTVGEEWGFIGCSIVVALFAILILRLIKMGDRHRDSFARIYCYCVASVFLFHVLVNIGMTIGIVPVIGIPLPFFSYGGSSLLAFTILLFVAVRLDSAKEEKSQF